MSLEECSAAYLPEPAALAAEIAEKNALWAEDNKPRSIETVADELRRFADLAREAAPNCEVWMYGSYAKGYATAASDIDVAVIVEDGAYTEAELWDLYQALVKIAADIDEKIEPALRVENAETHPILEGSVRGFGVCAARTEAPVAVEVEE